MAVSGVDSFLWGVGIAPEFVRGVECVPPFRRNRAVTSRLVTMAAFSQVDDRIRNVPGVVRLAAIPAPGLAPNAVTFATNTISTYNVFEAVYCRGLINSLYILGQH